MEVRPVVMLYPNRIEIDRGRTEGLLYCQSCGRTTLQYVTCPGEDDEPDFRQRFDDDGSTTFSWRCEKCEALIDLSEMATVAAVYARQAMAHGLLKIEEVTR